MTISLDGGITYKVVELKCPLLFIIGDIKGSDALAGRFNSHATRKRVSRMCDCPLLDADNTKRSCILNTVQYMEAQRALGLDALYSISQHEVKNAFHSVCFGGSSHGVYGCTPMDTMHSMQHGLMMYIQKEIFSLLNAAQMCTVDELVKATSKRRQSVKKQYPRSDFTNGITNVTSKTSSEHSGCIFMLALVLSMASMASADIRRSLGGLAKANAIRKVLERILCFEQWTKRETFWKVDDPSH
jgi:hypothetical protein